MSAQIIRGDARNLAIAGDSVDLIVTSPPYFGLRSYQDAGEHYAGQLGDEATPAEFVDALIACTREWMRVLKPSGSMWVNLGDKYAGTKSLTGIPWRYALRCIDDLGLILRANVIWNKPNGLPESVTDRVQRSHEDWFHFVAQPRYFSAVDEIREGYAPGDQRRSTVGALRGIDPSGHSGAVLEHVAANPLGKVPGSVWTVPTEPLRTPEHLGIDHFAAFPTRWPERIISGWTEPGMTVLDPFGGTGTTALAAHSLGRQGISNDMSADYCRLAVWRTSDPAQIARVRGERKPVEQVDGQVDLFGDVA